MKRVVVVVALVAVSAVAVLSGSPASGAPERVSVDVYIRGNVIKRVPGQNLALVDISWDYKCFGDKLGDSTYEWTLKILRRQPKPVKTMTLGTGTTKRGSMRTQLGPGSYLPTADPFLCETERGAGNDQPEIGAPFTVPDFCAWSVTASRGTVQLEQGAAVKLAKPGTTVRPGDSIVTPRGGSASLDSNGKDGTASIGASSSIGVDAKQCAAKGAWKLHAHPGSRLDNRSSSGRFAAELPDGYSECDCVGRPRGEVEGAIHIWETEDARDRYGRIRCRRR